MQVEKNLAGKIKIVKFVSIKMFYNDNNDKKRCKQN
jgi:hypothetical protein